VIIVDEVPDALNGKGAGGRAKIEACAEGAALCMHVRILGACSDWSPEKGCQ
jgi:hypothetical protein